MSEGCRWNGTSQCVNCGGRLRCPGCQCYIREDNMDGHFDNCAVVEKKFGPSSSAPTPQGVFEAMGMDEPKFPEVKP